MKLIPWNILSKCHSRVWWPRFKKSLESHDHWTSCVRNIVVVIGVILAFLQWFHNDRIEKRRIAIGALQSLYVRDSGFTKALCRLKTVKDNCVTNQLDDVLNAVYEQNVVIKSTNLFIDDLNFVLSSFHYAWFLLKISNNEIILPEISGDVRDLAKIVTALPPSFPAFDHHSLEQLLDAVIREEGKKSKRDPYGFLE